MAEDDLKSSANSIPGLEQLLSEIVSAPNDPSRLPPVLTWNPERCTDIGMAIDSDGRWWHEGEQIRREKLVRLFSTILRKEADGRHFLVTPHEKVIVHVDDAPFFVIRVDRAMTRDEHQALVFTTSVADVVVAGEGNELRVETDLQTLEPRPYLHVRSGLEAKLSRHVFYDLAAIAIANPQDDGATMGVWSCGQFFIIGPSAD